MESRGSAWIDLRVGAVEADGDGAMSVDGAHEILVDLTDERHLDDLHGLVVSHALTALEVRGYVEALEHGVDVGAAAMHDDGICAHELEHDDIVDHRVAELAGDHGRATVFDHDGLARDVLDPRQRIEQDLGAKLVGQRLNVGDGDFVVLLAKLHGFLFSSSD